MSTQSANPFVGLRPFESEESLLFFGRHEQIMELLQKLHEHKFVAVIGSSGSGKSSLIKAGLIPRLKAGYLVNKRDQWLIATMKPGQRPVHNLAEAIIAAVDPEDQHRKKVMELVGNIEWQGAEAVIQLLQPLFEQKNASVFILVDQFEELFRFCTQYEQKDEAIDFVNILLELANDPELPVYVAITMRSDFIGDCDQFYGLPEALNKSQYLVPKLNRTQLKTAIEGPVKLYGGKINPTLTAKLLNGTQHSKDELPLLQHILMRIWDHETRTDNNGELDIDDYEKVGGLAKALSNHAEEALGKISEDELDLAKEVFQNLTTVDENGRKIRRPARLSELVAITGRRKNEILKCIERFNDDKRCFLVINHLKEEEDVLVDISHESLIRQWNRLSEWADEETEAAKTYQQLVESAVLYQKKKKDLLTGSELQIGLLWHKDFNPKYEWAKRYDTRFDDTIEYLKQSEEEEKRNLQLRQKQKKNRMLMIAGGSLLAVALLASIWWAVEDRKKDKALRLISAAQNMVKTDPTIALGLAGIALNNSDDKALETIAEDIYKNNLFYKTVLKVDSNSIISIAPFGNYIASANGQEVQIFNVKGETITKFSEHGSRITALAFSSSSKLLVSASEDGKLVLWDVAANKRINSFELNHAVHSLVFSAKEGDNRFLAVTEHFTRVYNNAVPGDFFDLKLKDEHNRIVKAIFADGGIITGSKNSEIAFWNDYGELEDIESFHDHYNMGDGEVMMLDFNSDHDVAAVAYRSRVTKFYALRDKMIGKIHTTSPVQSAMLLKPFRPAMYKELRETFDEPATMTDDEFDFRYSFFLTANKKGDLSIWLLHVTFIWDKDSSVKDADYSPYLLLKIPGSGYSIHSIVMLEDKNSFLLGTSHGEVRKYTFINKHFNLLSGKKEWNMTLKEFLKSNLLEKLSKEDADNILNSQE